MKEWIDARMADDTRQEMKNGADMLMEALGGMDEPMKLLTAGYAMGLKAAAAKAQEQKTA